MLHSVSPKLSTQLGVCLIISSVCSSLSSFLSVSSFLFSKISLPDILKPVLTQAPTCTCLLFCFLSSFVFNCFTFITAFKFIGKAVKLQILNLGRFCGGKFTKYVFSVYKRFTHPQPSSFQIHLAPEDQEIAAGSSYSPGWHQV